MKTAGSNPVPASGEAEGSGVATPAEVVLRQSSSVSESGDELMKEAGVSSDGFASARPTRRSIVRPVAIVVVAGLLICACVAAVILARRRSATLNLPEKFSGSFVTQHRYDDEYRMRGRVLKKQVDGRSVVEGHVTYTEEFTGNRVVVSLIDKRAYEVTYDDTKSTTVPIRTRCYPEQHVPAVGDLGDLLGRAVQVDAVEVDHTNPVQSGCANAASRYAVVWGKQEFVYCELQDNTHVVASDNFNATVVVDSPTVTSLGLTVPTDIATGQPLQCAELEDKTELAVTTDGDTVTVATSRRRLRHRSSSAPTYTKRDCYFVHGLWSQLANSNTAASALSEYWGSHMSSRLSSYCSSFNYVQRDMLSSTWDVDSHAQAFCTVTAGSYKTGSTIPKISEKLIFSHGSGSLVVAHALKHDLCKLDDTEWFSANAPWEGFRSADYWDKVCDEGTINNFLQVIGLCPYGAGTSLANRPLGVSSLDPDYSALSGASHEADSKMSGALCGNTPSGLNGDFATLMSTISDQVSWGGGSDAKNDGLGRTNSCKDAGSGYDNSYLDDFTVLDINYMDGTGRALDPTVDTAQVKSPGAWYIEMARKSTMN